MLAMGDELPGSGRIEQLDGVRALAISAVFLNHAFNVKLLWMGVDLFFILSGLLITGVLLDLRQGGMREYFRRFYARRARRILPPYVLFLAVFSLVFGLAWARYWYLYLFLMNFVTALQLPRPFALGPLWSLAVEEQFYLVWPFAVYLLGEVSLGWLAGGLVVTAPLLRWFCTPLLVEHFPQLRHWPIYVLTPFRMDLLAAGALICLAWRHQRERVLRYGHLGLGLTAAAGVALVALSRRADFSTIANKPFANVWIYELGLLGGTGLILWALSGRGVGVLKLRPVVYLGRISYSVYLIHLLALVVVGEYVRGRVAGGLVALTITLLYASASWILLERPLLRQGVGGGKSE